MNLKQALERIEALERRVKELEASPGQHIHYHTHPAQPIYYGQPYYVPQPTFVPHWNQPICGLNSPQYGLNAIGGMIGSFGHAST